MRDKSIMNAIKGVCPTASGIIAYRDGYKYQIQSDYKVDLNEVLAGVRRRIILQDAIATDYISLSCDGVMTLAKGYAWDGPSGPTIDTKTFMRGSLIHDAMYQLMRERYLIPHENYRETADRLLEAICIQDGMNWIRAWYVYQSVRWFADPCADPAHDKPILYAP